MCGRVVVALDSECLSEIRRFKQVRNSSKYSQSFNMAPGRFLPTYYQNKNNENILDFMKWGTLNSNSIPLINARSENFNLFYKNWKRCVVIISGYYEWKKIFSKNDSEKVIDSEPYYIKSSTVDYLSVAGVYRQDGKFFYKISDEENVVLFVTKSANKLVEHIHDRMPLIINDELTEYFYIIKELFKRRNAL